MLSLLDCQNDSGMRRISGFAPTSQDFSDLVNESQRRIMRRGDFIGTVVPIFVCMFQGCVVMPRYVLEVRRMNVCNRAMAPRSMWYDFLPANQSECRHLSGASMGFSQSGQTAVLQDVMGEGRLIRAYPRSQADVGKTMTIFGTDNNGQPLITLDSNNLFVCNGQRITLATPFASTSTFVRHIDYIVRDKTQQIVDVYAYNAATNLLEDIAHYDPSETTPTYARYSLRGPFPNLPGNSGQPGCCNNPRGVLALVKLRYIPANDPTDLVIVGNVDALKKMFQSIKREDAYDIQGAKEFETDAIHEMNRELEDHVTDDQFAATDNTLGSHGFTNQAF